jgi:hypothetical protein
MAVRWLSLLALTYALLGHAEDECGCVWQGSFSEVQAQTDLVVAGTVVARKGNAIDLEIGQRLRGTETLDTIRIWMQTGALCRPPADELPLHSEWVLALNRIAEVPAGGFDPNTPNESYGREFDYYLSSCGGFFLKLSDDRASGNLVATHPRWDYEPPMTPVLLELVAQFVAGKIDADNLRLASEKDPKLLDLMLDTRGFLRGQRE